MQKDHVVKGTTKKNRVAKHEEKNPVNPILEKQKDGCSKLLTNFYEKQTKKETVNVTHKMSDVSSSRTEAAHRKPTLETSENKHGTTSLIPGTSKSLTQISNSDSKMEISGDCLIAYVNCLSEKKRNKKDTLDYCILTLTNQR